MAKAQQGVPRALTLVQLAVSYRIVDQPKREDSAFALALDAIAFKKVPAVEAALHQWYATKEKHHNAAAARRSVHSLMLLATKEEKPAWQAEAYRASAILYRDAGVNKEAEDEARLALHYTQLAGGSEEKIDAYLLLGECLQNRREYEEAFRAYFEAEVEAASVRSIAAQSRVKAQLSSIYTFLGDYENAKALRQEKIALDIKEGMDSVALMDDWNDLAGIMYLSGDKDGAKRWYLRVIDFGQRKHQPALLDNAFGMLRTQLIETKDIGALKDLYFRQYPDELRRISKTSPSLYARIQAFVSEYDGWPQAALTWYKTADSLMPKDTARIYQWIRFQQRYGEFLLRQNQWAAARQRLDSAYADAVAFNFPPFAADAAALLDSLARLEGDYVSAYRYAQLTSRARRQKEAAANSEKILLLKAQTDARTAQADRKRLEEATNRRYNLQYTGIIIGIALLFLVILLLPSAHVSPRKLRAISFLTFILLFEFIILIADGIFHHWTHGEPWQMILIKLVFIAGLSQVHHWMEHKLAHYVSTHQPLTELRRRVNSWWKKDTQHQTSTAPTIHPPVEPTESTDEIF